jgi:hypothetical protein
MALQNDSTVISKLKCAVAAPEYGSAQTNA